MKNVLVLLNGTHVPNYVLDSAINLGKEANSFLHALFLNNDPHSLDYNYFFPNDLALTQNNLTGKSLEEEDRELIETNIVLFQDACEAAGVKYTVDTKRNFLLQELIQYTAFFDLVLADAKSNFYEYLLSDLLTDAHCPVLLTKSGLETVDRITLTYDGSPSSIYAIKMFTYLFPEWQNKPKDLLYIASHEENNLPYDQPVHSWLSLHYNHVEVHITKGKVLPSLTDFIQAHSEHNFLVMGAYGRNALSRMFHKSLSKAVINENNAAVFITHK